MRFAPLARRTLLLWLGVSLPATAVAQGALTGRVVDEIERPIAGLQVRAWTDDPTSKSMRLAGEILADAEGAFRIEPLETGQYKVQVRMPPGMEGNWADRWVDEDDPFAGGWVAEDADWIEVVDGGEATAGDIVMLVFGGLDGRVLAAGEPLAGVLVRAETTEDCRRNHVDETDTGALSDGHRLGRFTFRGLVPGPTRLIAWHPSGRLATTVMALPFDVAADESPELEDFDLAALADDPHEPNERPADVGAGAPDAALFAETPPRPWRSSPGARIGPRGAGDQDWYCLYADDGDRFIATVTATLPGDLEAPCDEHPWVDPTVSIWQVRPDDAGVDLLVADDDSGPGRRGARADTGLLAHGGRICALVSTYGDADWSGQGRQSWGEYELELRMGNRPPKLDLFRQERPAASVERVAEGDAICLDALAEDPDGDALEISTELRNRRGEVIEEARFVPEGGRAEHEPAGRWCWTAGATAGDDSPFILDVTTRDDELGAKAAVRIEAQPVNLPPSVPTLASPADGARLDEAGATLVIENSEDGDGDPLKYHFEVHVGGVEGQAEHTASVPEAEGEAGVTSWDTPTLPDEARICWRARADDGRAGGLSDWSGARCFLVDAENAPPPTPRWNKPTEGELIYVPRPTISAWTVEDPEGDPVEIELELAEDRQFAVGLGSARLAQDPRHPTVSWRADVDLAWGASYFARARAHDDRGGVSDWTRIHRFQLKPNRAPTPTGILSPELTAACEDLRLTGPLPDPLLLRRPYDPEAQPARIQVQIFAAGQSDQPALDLELPAPASHDGGDIEVPTTTTTLEEGRRYIVRVRSGDADVWGGWSECSLWIDRRTAPVTDLRITHPAQGDRVPGPDRVSAHVEHAGWPDAEIPGRALQATWTLCKTYPAPAAGEGDGCNSVELDEAVAFNGPEASLPIGFLDLGHYTLEVCARAVTDSAEAPCAGMATSEFKVVHPGDPNASSSCDCRVGAPGAGAWWRALLRRR